MCQALGEGVEWHLGGEPQRNASGRTPGHGGIAGVDSSFRLLAPFGILLTGYDLFAVAIGR